MKKKIIVLGAGLVGKAIALDLAQDFEVTSVDLNDKTLKSLLSAGVNTIQLDFSKTEELKKVISPFDLVVGAVPGFLGFQTAKAVIESKKNMVDISFFPEDPFLLDNLAKENNVTIVTDCGVAPGMGNIILGYHNQQMKVNKYECLVGGLPVVREWPYEYKAVFSPIDVIEEYIRPARYVQNGSLVIKEALSDPENIYFEGIGTLESWNSDGLRSLIKTMPHIPDMIEKTLRYPGCVEYLRVLRESGYFSYDPVEVGGTQIRPIDLTAGEEEFTVMRIIVEGIENGDPKQYQYHLLDRTDNKSNTLSMARTTGYTCTAAANLVATEQYNRIGISPPEYLGEDETHFKFILNYLKDRNVYYRIDKRILN